MQGGQCSASVKSYFKELRQSPALCRSLKDLTVLAVAQTLQQTLPEKTIKTNHFTRALSWVLCCVLFFVMYLLLESDRKTIKTKTVEYNTPQKDALAVHLDEMEPPIYVYYELDNYYQNHRRYLKSRNNYQLKGDIVKSESSLTDCDPLIVADSHKSGPSKFYNPCGLVAASWFGDKNITVERDMSPANNTGIKIRTNRISWDADREVRFQSPREYVGEFPFVQGRNFTEDSFEDESFMNWMRISGLPRFRKLYGVIETKINKGKYMLGIESVVDVKMFDGKKYIVFATAGQYTGSGSKTLLTFVATCLGISAFGLFFTIIPLIQKYCRHKGSSKKSSLLLVGNEGEP